MSHSCSLQIHAQPVICTNTDVFHQSAVIIKKKKPQPKNLHWGKSSQGKAAPKQWRSHALEPLEL